jgi:hypothetical protein
MELTATVNFKLKVRIDKGLKQIYLDCTAIEIAIWRSYFG